MDQHRHLLLGIDPQHLGMFGFIGFRERHHDQIEVQPLLPGGDLGLGAKHAERAREQSHSAIAWWRHPQSSPGQACLDEQNRPVVRFCQPAMLGTSGKDVTMADSRSHKRRSNDPQAMRRRVLDAAAAAFQARGYHATSTHDIMREAGVTGGALHHHFPTKKALGLAVIADRVAQAVEETWIAPVRAAPTAAAGIREVFERTAASIDMRGSVLGCPLNNLALELSLADPEFQRAWRSVFEHWRAAIAQKLRADQVAGALGDGRPRRPGDLHCRGLFRGHGDGQGHAKLGAAWRMRAAVGRARATRSREIPPLERSAAPTGRTW